MSSRFFLTEITVVITPRRDYNRDLYLDSQRLNWIFISAAAYTRCGTEIATLTKI
ncbi:Hypothetical protein FKW44_018777 [Caligus rogercresseyi]|uniref:Uncharacterized protein n=1 Tax=Caligus rogercresseyi TaxID=217165 RepID=A0A7T8GUX0_CALRO|nr:Hypothetical protein FKW44_018777 [Caligus rogercresseyi]